MRVLRIKGVINAVPGFKAAAVCAKISQFGRRAKKDVGIIFNEDGPATASCTVTTSKMPGAHIPVLKENMADGTIAATVFITGNANVGTGERGIRDSRKVTEIAGKELGVPASEIAVAATGAMCRFLPMKKVEVGIKAAARQLSESREAGMAAAEALLTTDTFTKEKAVKVKLADGSEVMIAGIAKGCTMIRPRMRVPHATMMCFLTSDISISPDALRSALQEAVDQSFNMTMTEGDMSTNDTVIIMANGRAGNRLVQGREGSFQEGLNYVTRELAKLMAREGFSERFIEVQAKGASTLEDAREVARRVAGSPILRVSFHGADPNWGHFVHAIGMADAQIDPSKITLTVSSKKGRVTLINKGSTRAYSNPNDATLKRLAKTMEAKDVRISVELGLGSYEATAWTCDLSVDYVKVLSRSMRRMLRKEARTGG